MISAMEVSTKSIIYEDTQEKASCVKHRGARAALTHRMRFHLVSIGSCDPENSHDSCFVVTSCSNNIIGTLRDQNPQGDGPSVWVLSPTTPCLDPHRVVPVMISPKGPRPLPILLPDSRQFEATGLLACDTEHASFV